MSGLGFGTFILSNWNDNYISTLKNHKIKRVENKGGSFLPLHFLISEARLSFDAVDIYMGQANGWLPNTPPPASSSSPGVWKASPRRSTCLSCLWKRHSFVCRLKSWLSYLILAPHADTTTTDTSVGGWRRGWGVICLISFSMNFFHFSLEIILQFAKPPPRNSHTIYILRIFFSQQVFPLTKHLY